jgi:hypothetical protein
MRFPSFTASCRAATAPQREEGAPSGAPVDGRKGPAYLNWKKAVRSWPATSPRSGCCRPIQGGMLHTGRSRDAPMGARRRLLARRRNPHRSPRSKRDRAIAPLLCPSDLRQRKPGPGGAGAVPAFARRAYSRSVLLAERCRFGKLTPSAWAPSGTAVGATRRSLANPGSAKAGFQWRPPPSLWGRSSSGRWPPPAIGSYLAATARRSRRSPRSFTGWRYRSRASLRFSSGRPGFPPGGAPFLC